MGLVRDKFLQDPRYAAGKKLLIEALTQAQQEITSVRAPQNDLQVEYADLIDRFTKARGNPLFYPYLGSGIGNGPLVELADGSVKYDLISGIGVHYFGHSFAPLVESAIDGALSDTIMQGNLEQNQEALRLAELYVHLSKMDHCFLSTSGAMACENALKISFQKKHPAFRVLAFDHAFAGRTLALSQITDKPAFREGLPPTLFIDYVPFYDARDHAGSIRAAKEALLKHLQRHPHEYAAMCIELVQGEGGFYPGNAEFFKEIIHLLKEHGVLVWMDEVQTFARTEELFATHYFGLDSLADIITIGKVANVCATLFRKDLAPRVGLLSQTFIGSSSALFATEWMVSHAINNHFFGKDGKIASLSALFIDHLKALHEKYPEQVNGPYGIGTMIAFTALNGDKKRVEEFLHRLFENGVIAFMCGSNPARVRFLLPVGSLDKAHISPIMDIIKKTLQTFL